MAIQKTSNDKLQAIRSRSVAALPDRPHENGMSTSYVKEAFIAPIIGSGKSAAQTSDNYADSIIGELDRIVDEINAEMQGASGTDSTLRTTAQNLIGAINELRGKLTNAGAGNYTELQTTAKTVLEAINELKAAFDAHDEDITARIGTAVGAEAADRSVADTALGNRIDAEVIARQQADAGKADLVGGKVPVSQLPSYVDDVIEYASLTAFPSTGETGKIYVALDTNQVYRWSGTQYIEISPAPDLSGKVDKVTQGSGIRVPTTQPDGSQWFLQVTSEKEGGTAVMRNSNGQTKFGTPTDDDHAATKNYVDTLSGTITLAANAWSSNSQTVVLSRLGANAHIQITPASAQDEANGEAAGLTVTPATGSLTFTCTTVPTSPIKLVYIIHS